MTFNDFHEKLRPFFNDKQIENLDNYGAEEVRTTLKERGFGTVAEDTIRAVGREKACHMIANCFGINSTNDMVKESLEKMAGGFISDLVVIYLDYQIQNEW